MAYTVYVGGGTWDPVKVFVNGDGTGQFITECWTPLVGRVEGLKEYLTEAANLPIGGVSLDSQGASPGDPDGFGLLGFSGHTEGEVSLNPGTGRDLVEAIAAEIDARLPKTGGALTGALTLSGNSAAIVWRPNVFLAVGNASFGPTADVFVIPSGLGVSTTYTVNTTTAPFISPGQRIRILSRAGNANGDAVIIAAEGAGTIATFTQGDDYGWVEIGVDDTSNPPNHVVHVLSFGSDNASITLNNPYNLP